MAVDVKTLGAAKSYANSLVEGGGGIIKGKNCQISSIVDITDSSQVVIGQRVTFSWYLDTGVEQTSTMDVMYGEKGDTGVSIASITSDENIVTITLTNGNSYSLTIPTVQANALDDLSDCQIFLGTLANGQALVYDSTLGKWTNKNISQIDRAFNILVADWVANSGATATDYPYIAQVSTAVYNNNSKPIWQMNGVGTIPTAAEREDINLVLEAVFSSSGITLYAIGIPSGALVLEVKGE